MAKKRRRKKRRSGRKKIILFVFEILLLLIVLLVVWAYNKTLGQVKYEDALTNSEAESMRRLMRMFLPICMDISM